MEEAYPLSMCTSGDFCMAVSRMEPIESSFIRFELELSVDWLAV